MKTLLSLLLLTSTCYGQSYRIVTIGNNGNSAMQNQWKGKTILWIGTSIPRQGYPQLVGTALGATIINQSLGSSMMRIGRKDGTITGLPSTLVLRSFTHTLAEIATIKTNWSSIYPTLAVGAPSDLNAVESGSEGGTLTYAQQADSASFQKRLIPYLNGTRTAPDAIVIDHGYNDYQTQFYGSPIDTQNDFTTIPSTRNDRNYFVGAMNWLIDTILSYKPKMRIIISGHYEDKVYPWIVQGQQTTATYWNWPYINLASTLGWSDQTTGGVSIKNKFLATDGTHPSEADSKQKIADTITNFFLSLAN